MGASRIRMEVGVWVVRLFVLLTVIAAAGIMAAAPAVLALETGSDEPLRVALTGKYPPFSFYSSEGELIGFDVDVSRAIANALGRELEIITTEWDGILAGLLAGKYDAIIGSMAITAERKKHVNFSVPYYQSGAQLFIHQDDGATINGLDDIAAMGSDALVGAVLGETFEHFLRSNHPEIPLATYKSTVDIFQDMMNGRLTGFVTDRLVGLYQIRNADMPFVPAGALLYRERMAIPIIKGREALLAKVNEALGAMTADGTLDRIHQRWFGRRAAAKAGRGSITWNTVWRKLTGGFGVTLFVAAFALIGGFILAIPAGVVLHGRKTPLRWIIRALVDFIRGTPVLIQLFFVYYGLGSQSVGIPMSPIAAAIITLLVNSASYMAEVIRSGLMAVDAGQKIGARALGLSKFQTFRYVVWPQAFRVAIPPLMNSSVALLKDTALISVISVAEVIREAQSIISVTFDPMRYYLIVAVMFFVFTYPLMQLSSRFEQRLKSKGYSNA